MLLFLHKLLQVDIKTRNIKVDQDLLKLKVY
jgi:hypothetical protein